MDAIDIIWGWKTLEKLGYRSERRHTKNGQEAVLFWGLGPTFTLTADEIVSLFTAIRDNNNPNDDTDDVIADWVEEHRAQ
jgi:hypothetical protein